MHVLCYTARSALYAASASESKGPACGHSQTDTISTKERGQKTAPTGETKLPLHRSIPAAPTEYSPYFSSQPSSKALNKMSFRPKPSDRTKVYFRTSAYGLRNHPKSILFVYQNPPCVAPGSVHDQCMIALPLSSLDFNLVNGDMYEGPKGD